MATVTVNRITNANVLLDGNALIGKVEEVTIPQIKTVQAEHKALGMIGKLSYPSGVDKLEAKFKFNAVYPDVLAKSANPFGSVQLTVRGNLETYQGSRRSSEVPAVWYLEGSWMSQGDLGFKHQENVETEMTFNAQKVRCEIGGTEIFNYDGPNNIWVVDGEDLLANYRANLGL